MALELWRPGMLRSPFRDLSRMEREMEDLFGRFEWPWRAGRGAAAPAIDMVDAKDEIVLRADLSGDDARAIELYRGLAAQQPTYVNALLNLALLYEDNGRLSDAESCYRRVLHADPRHVRARVGLRDVQASQSMYFDEDHERREDRRAQILRTPISEFELSVRSRNCLAKMNIETLGDLIMKSEQELLSYKNFGETSLKEIKDMLAQKGLRLGQGLDQGSSETAASRNPLEATADQGLLDRPIETLNLSVRSRRCMERLGVKSMRDLINKTEVQLMAAKNFGMTSLNEIKKKLAELGLRLRG